MDVLHASSRGTHVNYSGDWIELCIWNVGELIYISLWQNSDGGFRPNDGKDIVLELLIVSKILLRNLSISPAGPRTFLCPS